MLLSLCSHLLLTLFLLLLDLHLNLSHFLLLLLCLLLGILYEFFVFFLLWLYSKLSLSLFLDHFVFLSLLLGNLLRRFRGNKRTGKSTEWQEVYVGSFCFLEDKKEVLLWLCLDNYFLLVALSPVDECIFCQLAGFAGLLNLLIGLQTGSGHQLGHLPKH